MNKKYYLNILLLVFTFCLFSCSDDYKLENKIENKELEFRETILMNGIERKVDKIEVTNVSSGVRYAKMELYGEDPLVVHAALIEYDETKSIDVSASGISSSGVLKTPSTFMAENTQKGKKVLATINGDFFESFNLGTGKPTNLSIGTVIQNGVVKKTANPSSWKTMFGIGSDGKPYLNNVEYKMSITAVNDKVFNITAINTTRKGEQVILYDSNFGTQTETNQYGNEFELTPVDGDWEKLPYFEEVKCIVTGKYPETGNHPINKGRIILSAHGNPASQLNGAVNLNDEVTIKIKPSYAFDSDIQANPLHSIGAQGVVIRKSLNAEINLSDPIEADRHPRSGIGYSNDKDRMALIVVEGRSDESVGVTATELADIFAYFHISNAVNLDGGGSSCLIIKGVNEDKPVNVLTDGKERAIANVINIIEKQSADN